MADILRAVRPFQHNQYYWFDAELGRSGLCSTDDWPVEWEPLNDLQIALVLPAERVVHAQLSVPKAIANDAEAVLYSLEDQLAEEVSALHAVVSNLDDDQVSVRAVATDWLEHWFNYFNEKPVRIVSIVSEVDLLNPAPDELVIGPSCIWQAEQQWLANSFDGLQALATANLLPGFRKAIRVDCAPVELQKVTEQFDGLPIDQRNYFEGLDSNTTSLATGSFAPSIHWQKYIATFKWPAAILALLLVVDFTGLALQGAMLRSDQAAIKQAQVDVYRQVQAAGDARDPYAMMRSMVVQNGGIEAAKINHLLIVFGELNTDVGVDLMRIDIQPGRDGALFAVTAPSLAKIDQLRQRAEQRGIDFAIEEQRMTGGRGNARIRLY